MPDQRKQSERIRDIAIAARHTLADALRPVLERQVREAAIEVEAGGGRNLSSHAAAWARQLMEAKYKHGLAFAVDGYRLGEVALGKSAGISELRGKAEYYDLTESGLIATREDDDDEAEVLLAIAAITAMDTLASTSAATAADKLAAVTTAAIVSETEAIIARRVVPDVAKYLAETSKLETQTTIARLTSIFNQGIAENKTVAEIARAFADEGASWVSGQGRADMMAQTMSQWAYNHGSMTANADNGMRTQFLAISDACHKVCQPLNGVIADDDGLFAGYTFPPHPKCRCTTIPVVEE